MKIQPKNHGDEKYKNFVTRYITTREMIGLHLSATKTLIKLASSTISIPLFKVATTIVGVDKRIVIGTTTYISLLRTPLRKTCEYTFDLGAFVGFNFSHTQLTIEITKKKRESSWYGNNPHVYKWRSNHEKRRENLTSNQISWKNGDVRAGASDFCNFTKYILT